MNRNISGVPQKILYSFFSGAIAPLAFSPYDIFLIGILSPALIIFLWLQSSPRFALFSGYIYGLAFFGFGVNWLHISINLFGGVNILAAIFFTALLIAFLAIFPALTGYIWRKCYSKNYPLLSIIMGIPAAWTISEWVRSWIFTGFPWLSIGYSQIDSVLAGIGPILGVFGISFATIFTATSLIALSKADKPQRIIISSLVLILWGFSWLASSYNWTQQTGKILSVALIQGAVPQELKWVPAMRQPTIDLYMNLSEPYLDRDLIIWPEAAIPTYYHEAENVINTLQELARKNDNALLIGLPFYDYSKNKYYNSAVLIDDNIHLYYKRHLVPFGEYIPVKFFLENILDYLGVTIANFSPGTETAPLLKTDDFNIGISICYEDSFGNEVIEALPQANLLVNVSNDAWFGDSLAPHQHMQIARMRALESGRFMVRTTNTGISAIINQKGGIVSQLPQFSPTVLAGNVILFKGYTPYSKTGNYPTLTLAILMFLGVMYIQKKKC